MIAVVVTFAIEPDRMAQFLPLVQENARVSVAHEVGCHQFDVWTDPTRDNEVFLYETYSDAAAFQAHLDSPHFRSFDQRTAGMVIRKDVRLYGEPHL